MEQFSLRWNNYLTQITESFHSLRSEEDLVDVTLSCEGRKLKAHKMLLSACSPYFRDIFKDNPCQHPVIVFRNTKFSDLEAIVDYIYKGEVNVEQDQLDSFLSTADLLEVKGLSEGTTPEETMVEHVDAPQMVKHKKSARSQSPEPTTSSFQSKKRKTAEDLGNDGVAAIKFSQQSLPVIVKEEKEDYEDIDDEQADSAPRPDNEDQNSFAEQDPLAAGTKDTADETLDSLVRGKATQAVQALKEAEGIKSTEEEKDIKVEAVIESMERRVAEKTKLRKMASPFKRAGKSAKMKSPLVTVTARGKLGRRVVGLLGRQQAKKPFQRPAAAKLMQPKTERIHIPKGLTVTVSSARANEDVQSPVTRSEDAKTPVGDDPCQYQGIPQEQQEDVGQQCQPVTGQEAPDMGGQDGAEVSTVEEEVKEPEFDYYGCEICKTEAKPFDRLSFNHKCPICPCMCFCAHLLKEHMRVIHGWFNVQRKFTTNF